MRCEDVTKMLPLYIDNELEEQESNEIANHLKFCEECSRELEDLLTIKQLLAEAPKLELPEGFREELHEKLVKCSIEEKHSNKNIYLNNEDKKSKTKKKFNWKVLSGIAAGILITVVSVSSLMNNNFKTKDFDKLESEQTAPQEAMPFNIAMEEATDSDLSINEAPIKYEAGNYNDEPSLNTRNRSVELPREDLAENIEVNPQMIILNGYIHIKVNDYDFVYNKIINDVISKGGFIKKSNTKYKDFKTDSIEKPLKEGSLVIRVPKNEFNIMISDIKSMGSITHEDIKTNDITAQYNNLISEKDNLKLRESVLMESIEKAQNIDEISRFKEELDGLVGNMDKLIEEISDLNELEALSTIEVYLEEVQQ